MWTNTVTGIVAATDSVDGIKIGMIVVIVILLTILLAKGQTG